MGLYNKYLEMKKEGRLPQIEELTVDHFKKLFVDEKVSDRKLASLFDEKQTRVSYLRRKHGVTIRNTAIDKFFESGSELHVRVNEEMKREIFKEKNISTIAKAITHFAFRNGPIEDIHADEAKKITDEDMKRLNKFMVNRLAYVFSLIVKEEWVKLAHLIQLKDSMFGSDWDEAIPDDGGMERIFKEMIDQFRN